MEVLSIYNPAYGSSFSGNNPLRMGSTLRISYAVIGSSLDLTLEDQSIVTKCELTTYEPDDLVDLELRSDPIPNKIIMKGEWLVDAITELDASQTDILNIRQCPRRPFFRISAKALLGSIQMDYPNERSVLETFICSTESKNNYKFSMIKTSVRAMKEASKVSIRTDSYGTLSMQFMIPVGEGRNSFVDFRILSLTEDDTDEETLAF